MLCPIIVNGLSRRSFSQLDKIESVGQKTLLMTGFVIVLSLLSSQPAGGNQPVAKADFSLIESRAYYNFSPSQSDAEHIRGASQPLRIQRRLPNSEDLQDLPLPLDIHGELEMSQTDFLEEDRSSEEQ